jgi:hypothetical protein
MRAYSTVPIFIYKMMYHPIADLIMPSVHDLQTKIIQIMPFYRLNELIHVTYTYMYILLKIPIIYPSNRVRISDILNDT